MPLDPVPPVPTAASYRIITNTLTVTFDRTLVPQPVTFSTLRFRVNNTLRRHTAGVAAGNLVTTSSVLVGPDVGVNELAYAPPPADIVDLITGAPTAPFANFPLTVIP